MRIWLTTFLLAATNFLINPFTPQSDKNLLSPNSITPESNNKVRRMKEMMTNP